MDKELIVPKWVLIDWSKIHQMPQNLSAQIVCPSPKVWDFDEKRLHWASVGCDPTKWNSQFWFTVANQARKQSVAVWLSAEQLILVITHKG